MSLRPTACFATPLNPVQPHGSRYSFLCQAKARGPAVRGRRRVILMSEEITEETTEEKKVTETEPGFSAPSLDTTVFSDFLEAAQQRLDEWREKAANIDTQQLTEDLKVTFSTLVDNALAGAWLERGELWGAIQLVFVFLLFRNPGYLDGLVAFLVGPVAMFAGIAISIKAAFDLGRENISIWPAPTPAGELVVEGLYSYVRHPIYSGVILSALGFSGATGSLERFALTIALAFFLGKKIEVEEKLLREKFAYYDDYMEDVPHRLVPKVW